MGSPGSKGKELFIYLFHFYLNDSAQMQKESEWFSSPHMLVFKVLPDSLPFSPATERRTAISFKVAVLNLQSSIFYLFLENDTLPFQMFKAVYQVKSN